MASPYWPEETAVSDGGECRVQVFAWATAVAGECADQRWDRFVGLLIERRARAAREREAGSQPAVEHSQPGSRLPLGSIARIRYLLGRPAR